MVERDRRVREATDMLQLTPYLERLPRQHSGGQRQRVGIGRTILRDPRVFCWMNHSPTLMRPLGSLPRLEIAKLHRSMHNRTMIYVTHEQAPMPSIFAPNMFRLNKMAVCGVLSCIPECSGRADMSMSTLARPSQSWCGRGATRKHSEPVSLWPVEHELHRFDRNGRAIGRGLMKGARLSAVIKHGSPWRWTDTEGEVR